MEMKIYQHDLGHMTKMAAMPFMYMVKSLLNSSLEPVESLKNLSM